jgi:outer membrane protein assembly factor BamC
MKQGSRFMKQAIAFAAAAAVLLLGGCGIFGKKDQEFKAASRPAKPLEVPPELTAPASDDRFVIPDPRTQTTFSTYQQRTAPGAVAAPAVAAVLPKIEGARLERVGDQRWLVVRGAPEAVWAKVHDFWIEAGFSLVREQPDVGIIETDWFEDRTKIPQDFIRQSLGRLLDRVWTTGTRDKYRTRLEKGAEPGTTEVYVSHRGLEEVFTNAQQDSTKWQPRGNDSRELEAEMLSRIMVKLGVPVAPRVASSGAPAPPRAAGSAAGVEPRNAVLEGNSLVVNDSFDRAWRRVGLALDRVGFTVEDRDRSKGLFFVRYIDPDAESEAKKKEGFWDSLKFWKPTPKGPQPQFRIHVGDAGGGLSQVDVQNAQGAPEGGPTGKRILALLFEQLK